MNTKKLTLGEMILAGSALVLLIASFIPLWAKLEFEGFAGFGGGETTNFSAWGSESGYDPYGFLLTMALLLALVAIVLVVLRLVGLDANLPVPFGLVYLGVAGLALLFMILTTVAGPDEQFGGLGFGIDAEDAGFEVSRGILLFLGLLLTAAMTLGAFMHMREGTDATAAVGPGAGAGPGTAYPPAGGTGSPYPPSVGGTGTTGSGTPPAS